METIFILNPLVVNGLSHPYHLDESTFIFRGVGSNFSFLFHFSMKFMLKANRMAPDVTLHFAASHLGIFCLPMSTKKDARLIWVNSCFFLILVVSHFSFDGGTVGLISPFPGHCLPFICETVIGEDQVPDV